jgi:asparagine synthase (glutamine-hydrolysing)
MCGIAGVLSRNGQRCDDNLLARMMRAVVHRGPDGQGAKILQVDGLSVGLGHQRLSIVDVAGGAQPMANEDQTIWIVFNGEIYNHAALREELEARGHRYSSRSDTETIVHAYEQWGDACLARLQGMFAFAIWDGRERRLLLARDRIGIKPLYYAITKDSLVFGSEIKAIFASGLVSPALALERLPEQMTFGYLAGEGTLLKGVSKLMPGHLLAWQGGQTTVLQYWDVPCPEPQPARADTEILEQFESLFDATVRSHLMSDVPLECFSAAGWIRAPSRLPWPATYRAASRHFRLDSNVNTTASCPAHAKWPITWEANIMRSCSRHRRSLLLCLA